MEGLFRHLLEISIMAGYLIVVVLLIRLLFRKASAAFICVLWMLVGIRLLVPVNISAPFSLVPRVEFTAERESVEDTQPDMQDDVQQGTGYDNNWQTGTNVGMGAGSGAGTGAGIGTGEASGAGIGTGEASGAGSDTEAEADSENTLSAGEATDNNADTNTVNNADNIGGNTGEENSSASVSDKVGGNIEPGNVAAVVWICGVVLMLGYMLASWLRLRRSLRMAVPDTVSCGERQIKVYRDVNITSPFLLGMISPKIYLPYKMAEKDLQYVLAHEITHIRRKDHLLKPLSFLVLAVYWFHPLVWVAYILLGRDIELACDERVMRDEPAMDRAAYAQALLSCAVNQRKIAVCPVAFGESDVKKRVKNVLNYKKAGFWIMLGCAVLGVIVVLCFMTVSDEGENENVLNTGTEKVEIPTSERIAKYPMYLDVIDSFEGDEGESLWKWAISELIYERSRWYEDYNGEKLQRIQTTDEHFGAAKCPDIIYYKADEGEKPEELVIEMIDAMIEPLMEPSENRAYTIKEYTIRNQQLIQVGDSVWLLPFIDGYYDFEGMDMVSMEHYRESEPYLEWNGMMPFERQGSAAVFYYFLIEEDSVYRLQLADDMMSLGEEMSAAAGESRAENELVFYYPVNSLNAPGYEPPNEHELIAPDCFWVGAGNVFIDDTVNDRILVYQNGFFLKSISLPRNMDVKQMYYNQQTDELSVVFSDRNVSVSNYYLTTIDVSSGMIMDAGEWDNEIGNTKKVLGHYCFDSEGVLLKDIFYDKMQIPSEEEQRADNVYDITGGGSFPYTISENATWKLVAKNGDEEYYHYSAIEQLDEGYLSRSCVMKNDTMVATPVVDWNGTPYLNLGADGNLYQMIADETGVRIYRLGFSNFSPEDRDDMLVRQIHLDNSHARQEIPVNSESAETFNMLTLEQLLEWTNSGNFESMAAEQGMSLFEGYDNLKPTVLYKNATGASYSCTLPYDGIEYEFQLMYQIERDAPDQKTIDTIYITCVETGDMIIIYTVKSNYQTSDLQDFVNRTFGLERSITYTLPEGFTLGAYRRDFAHMDASLLGGDVEEQLHGAYAPENWYAPGGIGVMTHSGVEHTLSFENGELSEVSMRGNHMWKVGETQKVDGCFASAILAEFSFDMFTAAEAWEYMQQHPGVSADLGPSRFWYVFIGDESSDNVYVVFLNQLYFTKEDVLALARSIKPLEVVVN